MWTCYNVWQSVATRQHNPGAGGKGEQEYGRCRLGTVRMTYILSDKPAGCMFCEKPRAQDDTQNLILCAATRPL